MTNQKETYWGISIDEYNTTFVTEYDDLKQALKNSMAVSTDLETIITVADNLNKTTTSGITYVIYLQPEKNAKECCDLKSLNVSLKESIAALEAYNTRKREMAFTHIIEAVDRALEKYDSSNIDVTRNEEHNTIDIIYHSRHNSFIIESNITNYDYIKNQRNKLEIELNSRHIGYCW